jgi:hypothetical protein
MAHPRAQRRNRRRPASLAPPGGNAGSLAESGGPNGRRARPMARFASLMWRRGSLCSRRPARRRSCTGTRSPPPATPPPPLPPMQRRRRRRARAPSCAGRSAPARRRSRRSRSRSRSTSSHRPSCRRRRRNREKRRWGGGDERRPRRRRRRGSAANDCRVCQSVFRGSALGAGLIHSYLGVQGHMLTVEKLTLLARQMQARSATDKEVKISSATPSRRISMMLVVPLCIGCCLRVSHGIDLIPARSCMICNGFRSALFQLK